MAHTNICFASGSPASNLPQELVDEVVNHIFDDKPSLLQICTVSHSWMVSCRYHLFSTVTIRSSHYTDGRVYEAFVDFARSRPAISGLIRTFRLSSARYPRTTKKSGKKRPVVSTQTLWNLLDVLDMLECVHLLDVELVPSGLCGVEYPLTRRFRIRRMLLDNIQLEHDQGINLHRLLSPFSHIDELELDRCTLVGEPPVEVTLLGPPTEVKHIITLTEYPTSLLRLLFKLINPTSFSSFGLRSTHSYTSHMGTRFPDYGSYYRPIREAIPAAVQVIEQLRIDFNTVYNSGNDLPSHRFVLQDCCSLRTLIVSFSFPPLRYPSPYGSGSIHPWNSPLHLIHSAPSTIRHIVFELRFKNAQVRKTSIQLLTSPEQTALEELILSDSFPELMDVTFVLRTFPYYEGSASLGEQTMFRNGYPRLWEKGKLRFGKQGYFVEDRLDSPDN